MNQTTRIQKTSLSRILGGDTRKSLCEQGRGQTCGPLSRSCFHTIPTSSRGVPSLTILLPHPVPGVDGDETRFQFLNLSVPTTPVCASRHPSHRPETAPLETAPLATPHLLPSSCQHEAFAFILPLPHHGSDRTSPPRPGLSCSLVSSETLFLEALAVCPS